MSFALPVLPVWKWVVAFLAAFLVGISKTGIAGVGIVAVALFSVVWPGKESLGITLIVLVCADCIAILSYPPKSARWDIWRGLAPWAALGVFLGTLVVKQIPQDAEIKRLIGVVLLVIVALQFYVRLQRKRGQADPAEPTAPPAALTAFTGLAAGAATLIANAAGPIMVLYLLRRRLPKGEFVGTTAWFFFALNLFKVPFSWNAGMMNASSPIAAGVLLPAAILGGIVGKWLLPRIEQNAFEVAALVLTAIASARLLLS